MEQPLPAIINGLRCHGSKPSDDGASAALAFPLSPTIVPRILSLVDSHVCRFVAGHCFEKEELVEIMLDLEEKTQVRANEILASPCRLN